MRQQLVDESINQSAGIIIIFLFFGQNQTFQNYIFHTKHSSKSYSMSCSYRNLHVLINVDSIRFGSWWQIILQENVSSLLCSSERTGPHQMSPPPFPTAAAAAVEDSWNHFVFICCSLWIHLGLSLDSRMDGGGVRKRLYSSHLSWTWREERHTHRRKLCWCMLHCCIVYHSDSTLITSTKSYLMISVGYEL